MDTTIRTGKEFKNLAKKTITMKKMFLYNNDNNLLVYKNPNKIYLPTVITDSEEKFIADIHHKLNISFLDENVECFFQLLDYLPIFERTNNKLKKVYVEKVRDYYSCLVDLDNVASFESKKGIEPSVISVDESLEIMSNVNYNSHTLYALNNFKQKVKERKIC